MNFGHKILEYKDELLSDLNTLLGFESVSGEKDDECDKALDFILKRAKDFGLAASATLTLQDAKDKTEGSATYGSQLPYTPKTSGGLSAMLSTPWINIGYSATGQGKRYSLAQNTRQYQLDAYMEHSLSLSRQLNIKRVGELTLQLTVNNLTNKQYEIIKYYPMPGRSVTATAVIKI